MSRRLIPILGGAFLEVTWDAEGTGTVRGPTPVLEEIRQNLNNRQPFARRVFNVMRASFRKTFLEGGRPSWQDLRPATVARKQGLINQGTLPPQTATGRIPIRVRQRAFTGGTPGYAATNKLIEKGDLRDSWSVKGARGHVETVTGDQLFIGSQYTLEGTLAPEAEVRHYHILSKKSLGLRARGQRVPVRVPLARIHQEGAPNANIPARPVGVVDEDLVAVQGALIEWFRGDLNNA